ncbi:MAG: GYF domain-containing protein [Prevotella sp.]|uniref:GYF domain-containing protein n=1 Tax=Prevotella sp. TaxID=59823 RepID=UPI002A345F28|nr:GYF domain-containing protein [Prevotella sp.]MDD7318526.1 GYF domain-containing protein [Prevotellaceae bacterium]MDY4020327.1 GYF domain-containing protein [Prevotella sp.]
MEYYVIIDGRQCGPYSHEELRSKFVTPEMQVWHAGMEEWTSACNIPEIRDVLQSEHVPPPYYSGGVQQYAYGNRQNEYIPPIPDDYKTSNIILIIFGFCCCSFCIPGSVLAIISYIKSNDMKTMHALGNYEMMAMKAAEMRKFHKWAIWADVVLMVLGAIAMVLWILFIFGSFVHITSQLD